jgi:hypothetical protein
MIMFYLEYCCTFDLSYNKIFVSVTYHILFGNNLKKIYLITQFSLCVSNQQSAFYHLAI